MAQGEDVQPRLLGSLDEMVRAVRNLIEGDNEVGFYIGGTDGDPMKIQSSFVPLFGILVLVSVCGLGSARYHIPCSTTNTADIVLAVADSKLTAYRSYYGYSLSLGLSHFIRSFISQCDYSKNRLAIVAYSNTVRYISPFSNNPTDLHNSLNSWRPEFGGAATNLALQSIRSYFSANSRPTAAQIVVVVTPQQSHNYQATVSEGQLLRQDGVGIIGVGYGRYRPVHELIGMTGNPHQVFLTPTERHLPYAMNHVKTTICKLANALARTTTPTPTTMMP